MVSEMENSFRSVNLLTPNGPERYLVPPDELSDEFSPKAPHAIGFKAYFITDDWNILCLWA